MRVVATYRPGSLILKDLPSSPPSYARPLIVSRLLANTTWRDAGQAGVDRAMRRARWLPSADAAFVCSDMISAPSAGSPAGYRSILRQRMVAVRARRQGIRLAVGAHREEL